MSLENDFVPFATAGGANVETPATWASDATRQTGFTGGPVPSEKFNTALRQSSEIAATIGQFIADYSGAAALDNGNITQLETNFIAGIEAIIAPFALQYSLIDTGTQNHIVATFHPSSTATVTAGMAFLVIPAFSCTGPSTLTPNGQGPFPITNPSGTPLSSGQYSAGGFIVCAFDGTHMQLLFSQSAQSALNVPANQTMVFPAGVNAINVGDLLEIGGPGSLAYPVQVSDYAGVYSVKTFLPSTPYASTSAGIPGLMRWPIVQDIQGNLYTLSANAAPGQLVQKSSPTGVFIGSITLGSDASGLIYGAKLVTLSNGNMAAVYALPGGALKYAVFDVALNIIKNETAVATVYNTGSTCYFDAVAISAGGFAIVYQTSAATAVQVITYSNTGAVVVAATTTHALSGTSGLAFLRITQLSSVGSVLLVGMRTTMYYGSSGSGNAGSAFSVVTVGSSSLSETAFGNVDTTATFGFLEIRASASGYFGVIVPNGTNLVGKTYSNAGVASTSGSWTYTTNSSTYIHTKILDNGAQFWLLSVGTSSGVNMTLLPYTGTAGTPVLLGSGSSYGGINWAMDATLCNGMTAIFLTSTGTGGQAFLLVGNPNSYLGISSPYVIQNWQAIGSASSATGTNWPRIFHAGDWTVAFLYEQITNGEVLWQISKIAQSSIEGVALNSNVIANPGDPVTTYIGPGSYPCNTVRGTLGTNYDHNYASPAGNQVAIYANGVAMQGIIAQQTAQLVLSNPYSGINLNDLVYLGQDNYAYSAKVTDFTAQGQTGNVIAPTQLTTSSLATQLNSPLASCVNLWGNTIVVSVPGSNVGIMLHRISTSGAILGTNVLETSGTFYDPHLDVLNNGNIVLTAVDAGNLLYIWILDDLIRNVLFSAVSNASPWPAGETIHIPQHTMRSHPAGGFFIIYQGTATNQSRFVYFSNTGAILYGPVTLSAWTGTLGVVWHNARVLSNGNIAIAYLSAYTATIGHYISVISPYGTVVLAPFLVNSTCRVGANPFPPDIDVHPGGYWATCAYSVSGTTHYAWVWSNAGILQGSPYSVTAATAHLIRPKIICDGVGFWHHYDIAYQTYLAFIPITGGSGSIQVWTSWAWSYASAAVLYHDAYYENGHIVFGVGGQTGSSAYGISYAIWNTTNYVMEIGITAIGSTFANQIYWPHIWTGGDFCLMHAYALTASQGHYFGVIKWYNTAVLGVARATVGPDEYCPVSTFQGSFPTNINTPAITPASTYYSFATVDIHRNNVFAFYRNFGLFGTTVVQFDHSVFNSPTIYTVYGSKGTIAGSSVNLSGLAIPLNP